LEDGTEHKVYPKGVNSLHLYGNITPAQWALLVDENTSLTTLAKSAQNREQAKKNQHHPRLGPGGYEAKEEQFRKMDVEAKASGNTTVTKLKPHIRRWTYARSVDESGSSLKFAKLETTEAVSRILKYAENRRRAHSLLPERGTSLALAWETPSTQATYGARKADDLEARIVGF
jgi:hypothetical protein